VKGNIGRKAESARLAEQGVGIPERGWLLAGKRRVASVRGHVEGHGVAREAHNRPEREERGEPLVNVAPERRFTGAGS